MAKKSDLDDFIHSARAYFPEPEFYVEVADDIAHLCKWLRVATRKLPQALYVEQMIDEFSEQHLDQILRDMSMKMHAALIGYGHGEEPPISGAEAQAILALCKIAGFELISREAQGFDPPRQYFARCIGGGMRPIYPFPDYYLNRPLSFWQMFIASLKVKP